MKKEVKDRTKQNEFLALIERCIQAYEDADSMFNEVETIAKSIPGEISLIDSERCDYLHILENYELTNEARECLMKKLEDVSERRRNALNISCLVGTWNNNKNKVNNANNRVFLRQAIKTRLSTLDMDYNFRVLSDEDVNMIINTKFETLQPKKKRGRKPGTKNLSTFEKQEILKRLANGEAPEKISEDLCISMPRILKLATEAVSEVYDEQI